MQIEQLQAYTVIEKQTIGDLNSVGYLLRHNKTGARVALLSNDDENKVFYIGFRTPPKDSTGVAHIVEHTVLCGSDKFPVKDPFIELAKGSLNTFLNAMTYPDKTVYPVASCNDKDFQNLMDVYLDAVLHPNIYREEKIFRQEAWHYEMESADDPLTINGVVYSEMKGAYSSPDDVLEREIMNSLYPHTSYAVESGGDPDVIPELTYEDFLAFHQRYYHPSNSYIYLYGNMDMAEKLRYIDEEYLSKYDALAVDSTLATEPAFAEMLHVEREYSIMESESEQDNTYLAYNVSLGELPDPKFCNGFAALADVLCSMPGAPRYNFPAPSPYSSPAPKSSQIRSLSSPYSRRYHNPSCLLFVSVIIFFISCICTVTHFHAGRASVLPVPCFYGLWICVWVYRCSSQYS